MLRIPCTLFSGPVDYKPGEAVGAPDHPHRGFDTVTYVVDGGVKHQDSIGNKGIVNPTMLTAPNL
jgi:redox-sensitive bicupin YhaK (pirin superfamily)